MKPTINLATHSHINRRALLTGYAVVGSVLLLTLIFNLIFWVNSNQHLARIDAHILELGSQLGIDTEAPPVSEAEFNAQLKKIRFSNQVIAKDSYRWTELLGQVEKVLVNNVRVSSIDPDFKENRINLKGEAKRVEDLQAFLDALEASAFFHDILLLSQFEQEADKGQGGLNVISFSLKVGGGRA